MSPESPNSRPSFARVLTIAAAGLSLAALPVFLVGGLGPQIRAELEFSAAALGTAVTIAFLAGGLFGPLGGRAADRLGARRSIVVGASLSVITLLGIGLWVQGWWQLVVMLAVGGTAFSFLDPGLAVLVSTDVPERRQGLAFGVKEASIPAASFAAGVAVPLIALTLGWRWALVVGVVPLTVLTLSLRGVASGPSGAVPVSSPVAGTAGSRPGVGVYLVALAAAFGSSAGAGVGVFLTESGVAMGLAAGAAGLLLATGGVAGIITRVGAGAIADRGRIPLLGLMSGMLVVGAASMSLAGTGSTTLLVIGAIGAFSGGWGWSGLMFLILVRAHPTAPGVAAGIGLFGLAVGNALGPLAFGATAESFGFEAAWLLASAMAGIAGLMAWVAMRFLPQTVGSRE